MCEFGSLSATLAASPSARLLDTCEVRVADFLTTIRSSMVHCLRRTVERTPVLGSFAAVHDYLCALLADESTEQLRVLYLDAANRLIRDEVAAIGTVTETVVHPRIVMGRAMACGAAGLILVHNHPSGRAKPSKSDLAVTRRLVGIARELDIIVHDHLIVGGSDCFSMREAGLL